MKNKKNGINWSISYYFYLILLHSKGVKFNTNSSESIYCSKSPSKDKCINAQYRMMRYECSKSSSKDKCINAQYRMMRYEMKEIWNWKQVEKIIL